MGLPEEVQHRYIEGRGRILKPYPDSEIECTWCGLIIVQAVAIAQGPVLCPGLDRRKGLSDRRMK
jgi:hypothetical protein